METNIKQVLDWSSEEKQLLRDLTLSPHLNHPGRLKKLVEYAARPEATAYGLTHGMAGTERISKGLAVKILDLTRARQLDWILARDKAGAINLDLHRRLAVDVTFKFRDAVMSGPKEYPSLVAETLLREQYGMHDRPPLPEWQQNDMRTSMAEHLNGSRVWELLESRQRLHNTYHSSSEGLALEAMQRVLDSPGLEDVVRREDSGLVASLQPWRNLDSLATGSEGEFLTTAVGVLVVSRVEVYKGAADLRFLHTLTQFSGRPQGVIAKALDAGRVALWWGDILVGVVREEIHSVVDQAVDQVAGDIRQSEAWRSILMTYDRLHWNSYVPDVKDYVDELVKSDRLASAVVAGGCSRCSDQVTLAPR